MKLVKLIIILIIVMILVTGCGKQAVKKTSKTVETNENTAQPIQEKAVVKTVTETKTAIEEEPLDLGVTSNELDELEREFNDEFVEDIDILGFE